MLDGLLVLDIMAVAFVTCTTIGLACVLLMDVMLVH